MNNMNIYPTREIKGYAFSSLVWYFLGLLTDVLDRFSWSLVLMPILSILFTVYLSFSLSFSGLEHDLISISSYESQN